jgi:hypothetical protein
MPKREKVVWCLNELQEEQVDWLWPGRVAAGKLTLPIFEEARADWELPETGSVGVRRPRKTGYSWVVYDVIQSDLPMAEEALEQVMRSLEMRCG